jgi:hypothetical protein
MSCEQLITVLAWEAVRKVHGYSLRQPVVHHAKPAHLP